MHPARPLPLPVEPTRKVYSNTTTTNVYPRRMMQENHQ